MQIADRINAVRTRLGLTQQEASEKWGINLRTLQNWECGRNEPRGFALAQLEKLLSDIESRAKRKPDRTPS